MAIATDQLNSIEIFTDCVGGFFTVENAAHLAFEEEAVEEDEGSGLDLVDVALGGFVDVGVGAFADDIDDLALVAHDFAGEIGDHAHRGDDGASSRGFFFFDATDDGKSRDEGKESFHGLEISGGL